MKDPREDESSVTWDDVQGLMNDLKQTARSLLAREGNAGSVHSTQLVNSALKKLAPKAGKWDDVAWSDRDSFFKDAHFSMRRLLVDYARRRIRRNQILAGGFETEQVEALARTGELNLDQLMVNAAESEGLAEALTLALDELEQAYPERRLADIVQFRVFEGLGQLEIATLLGVSERTVRTYEKLAYGLLRKALKAYF